MKSIAIYCGSSPGNSTVYTKAAQDLALFLTKNKITIVYGGGNIGLMGAVADAALANKGKVIGVIPQHIEEREVAHTKLTKMYVVATMHQRKKLIEELSDAFIALPGGLGTMDEIFEIITWAQLGLHRKPCAFLNVNGYFDFLIQFIDSMVDEGFLLKDFRDMIVIDDSIESIIAKFENYKHPEVNKTQVAIAESQKVRIGTNIAK